MLKSPALQADMIEKTEKRTEKQLTIADLWNIHRMHRVRSQRKHIG